MDSSTAPKEKLWVELLNVNCQFLWKIARKYNITFMIATLR